MSTRTYSHEIAQKIINNFDEHELKYHFDEDKGRFILATGLDGAISSLSYLFIIKENKFIVLGKIPVKVDTTDETKVKRINEFFCRINNSLIRTHFDFDRNDGEIQSVFEVPCDDMELTDEMIANSLFYPALMVKRFSQGIMDILYTDKPVKEVVEGTDNKPTSLADMLSKALGMEGSSPDELIKALRERAAAVAEQINDSTDGEDADDFPLDVTDATEDIDDTEE